MSPRRRAVSRIIKAFLPIILVVLVAVAAVTLWIVRGVTHPPRAPYLVTPQTFSQVTGPVLNADDVTWPNHDRTTARGWLIRGAEGAPAVILLHGYGADRSWLLNLAVKRSEEHTSELQSRQYLVCRLLLEKKKELIGCATSIAVLDGSRERVDGF